MTDCPCCSNQMLRHVRQSEVYWFCRQCWQEMPVYNLSVSSLHKYGSSPAINLVPSLATKKKVSALAVV
jgi:DNA-directed RNA polymerase subunit M/transcription elongation factor TFIIS